MTLRGGVWIFSGTTHYGEASEMEFAIGNFHHENMGVTLDMNGREVTFNIGNYMEAFKLKDVRLYLLSKKVTSGSEESDDDLPPMLTVCDSPTSEMACAAGGTTGFIHNESQGLRGTSEERCSLKREQDRENELSVEEDRQKRLSLERANTEAEQKKRVQEARAARLSAEPDADFVTLQWEYALDVSPPIASWRQCTTGLDLSRRT